MPTCGAASPPGGLLLLEPGEQQRFLAALVEFRKMILHARLAASAAGLDAGTFELVVRSAGLGNCGTADQGVSARCRELGEVLADARRDPAVAGLDPGAHSVDVRSAGLPRRPRPDHSPASPASRSPGKYVASAKARILGWSNQVDFATRSRLE